MAWKLEENVLNKCGSPVSVPPGDEGRLHRISLYAVDKYFAFPIRELYGKERKENNLTGLPERRSFPWDWDADRWTEDFTEADA